MLSLAVAGVLIAHSLGSTVRDVRHKGDKLQVTGSAKIPIDANLVRWTVRVTAEASQAPPAVRRLRRDAIEVRDFLQRGGVPNEAISASVVQSERIVEHLSKTRSRTYYRATQRLEVSTRQIDAVEPVTVRIGQLIELHPHEF